MEIYINGQQVDFSLEKEKFLSEIILVLEEYIGAHNDYITHIKVNGENILVDNAYNNNMLISQINNIEMNTESILSQAEVMLSHINSMITQIKDFSLDESIIIENKEAILQVLEGIHTTLDNTSNLLYVPFSYVFTQGLFLNDDMNGLLEDKKQMEDKIRDNQAFIKVFKEQSLVRLDHIQNLFIPSMVDVYNVFYAKEEEYLSKSFFKHIKILKENMNLILETGIDVATNFQIGKDIEGIKGLEKFLILYEFTSQIILRSSLLKLVDTDSIAIAQEKIQTDIKTMDTALAEKDMITLCDTLEYEYIPALQELIELLPIGV